MKNFLKLIAPVDRKTTNLTGLFVAKHPHHQLSSLYGKILRTLVKMPETAAYRKHTENIIRERADIVMKTESVADIEARIKCGRIEELIVQAENELLLARKFLVWKPWEKLYREAPPRQWEWPPARIHPQN